MPQIKKVRKNIKSQPDITVSEFKSWISGVVDMQTTDWVPTPQQWAKIKQKIDALIDTPQGPHISPQTQTHYMPSPMVKNDHLLAETPPAKVAPLYSEIDLTTQIDSPGGYISPLI